MCRNSLVLLCNGIEYATPPLSAQPWRRYWLNDPNGTRGGSRWLTRGMFLRGLTLYNNSVGLLCASNHVRAGSHFVV